MKITTEGLTLGVIAALERKGYKVEIEGGGEYANVTKETPVQAVPDTEGWGSVGESL